MKSARLASIVGSIFLILGLSACGAGGNPPGSNSNSPPAAPIVVSISPVSLSCQIGQSRQLTASIGGGGSNPGGVNWQVVQGSPTYGSVDSTGLYTAPATMPPNHLATVRAVSQNDPNAFADATVSLQAGPVPGAFPVEFEVTKQSSWQVAKAPVTVGIPMPAQLHTDENTLQVSPKGGGAVDAQFRVTSRWPDGSIRWVLVDFIADLSGAGGVGEYELEPGGSGNATGTDLTVADGATDIVVNTGHVAFTVSKTGFRLFDSVMIDRDSDGQVDDECLDIGALKGIVVSEGVDEYLMDQAPPTAISVEEQGPIRVTLKAEGVHRSSLAVDKLHYVVRITAWNDLPFIKVQYTFKNMQGDGQAAPTNNDAAAQLRAHEVADAIELDLPLDLGTSNVEAAFGGQSGSHSTPPMATTESATLLQTSTGGHDAVDPENPQPAGYNSTTGEGTSAPLTNAWPEDNPTHIEYTVDGAITDSGEHAMGWMQMAGGGMRVTAAVREFWQHYPKSLAAQGDGLMRIGIWPAGTWPLEVFAGAQKTHEVLLSFDPVGSIDVSEAETRANIANEPPVGVCLPRHYAATRVFGEIGWTDALLDDSSGFRASSRPFVEAYMDEVIDHFGDVLFDRSDGNGTATGHEYGMWNWGDGKHDSPVAGWENNDWGITSAALQWFAMSGNLGMWYLADVTARHFRDVDVLHTDIGTRFDYSESGNPAVNNGKASRLGGTRFFPSNKQHDLGAYRADGDPGLDVFKGAFLARHYLLTGDALSLDVLKEINIYLRGTWKRHFDAGNGGVDSTMTAPTTWLSNGMMIAAAYEMANGMQDTSAESMTDFVLNVIRTRQNTSTPTDGGGNGYADSNGDFRAWQVGHLVESLEYARWVTGDASIDSDIERGMGWLLGPNADVYLGQLSTPQFGEFAEQPGGTTDFGGPNLMIGAGYVGAHRELGNNNWLTAAENLLDVQTQNIDDATIGDDAIRHRTFAQFFRAGPLLLGTLKQ